jgi:ribosomal protein S18 acetylase RimI-like enzyme
MELTFENTSINDIDSIFNLSKNLIEKYEIDPNIEFEKVLIWVKGKIEKNIKNYQCIYFKGIKAGYYCLYDSGEKMELDDLYVFDEFQRKGIGTEILKHTNSIAKEKGKDIFLYVFVKNEDAIKLYLRNGYKIVKNINDSRYIMEIKNG